MTRAGQGAGRGRRARRPGPPAGGPCSPLSAAAGDAAARAHARGWLALSVGRWEASSLARGPAADRQVPSPPRPCGLRLPRPGARIYRCARPALALRSALCNNTVSRVGNETWEENKAAGGGRGGRRREARGPRRRKRRRKGKPRGWRGGGSLRRVQVVGASRGELVAPGVRGSQPREASTFCRRARTGDRESGGASRTQESRLEDVGPGELWVCRTVTWREAEIWPTSLLAGPRAGLGPEK